MSVHRLTLQSNGSKPTHFNLYFALGEGYGCYCMLTTENCLGKEYHVASWESDDEDLQLAMRRAENSASCWLAEKLSFDTTWSEVAAIPLENKP